MAAASVSGVGQGSADKLGNRGSERDFVGVEKLIGVRIVLTGNTTLSGGTATVVFGEELPGVDADYQVLSNAANFIDATVVATTGFTLNGSGSDVVNWAVIRNSDATVSGGPPGPSV